MGLVLAAVAFTAVSSSSLSSKRARAHLVIQVLLLRSNCKVGTVPQSSVAAYPDRMQAVDTLQTQLTRLGLVVPSLQECLHPGAERAQLVAQLLQCLLQPVSLEQVLSRVEDGMPVAQVQQLSMDERLAHRYASLLTNLGLPATAEQVRGSVSYQESAAFLQLLTSTLSMQQDLQGSTGAVTANGISPRTRRTPAATTHAASKLLEYVCERLPELVADSHPLFPTDIVKACQMHSDQAKQVLVHHDKLTAALQHICNILGTEVQKLSKQVQDVSDQQWGTAQQECVCEAQRFTETLTRFLDLYQQELCVWCEGSERPDTHGFGQQAAAMVEAHSRMTDLLSNVTTIRSMHKAITSSGPPLQAYSPQAMLQLASQGQQEASRLAKELLDLRRSRSLKKAVE